MCAWHAHVTSCLSHAHYSLDLFFLSLPLPCLQCVYCVAMPNLIHIYYSFCLLHSFFHQGGRAGWGRLGAWGGVRQWGQWRGRLTGKAEKSQSEDHLMLFLLWWPTTPHAHISSLPACACDITNSLLPPIPHCVRTRTRDYSPQAGIYSVLHHTCFFPTLTHRTQCPGVILLAPLPPPLSFPVKNALVLLCCDWYC